MGKDRPDWAKRLKEARESCGFSQRKFAQMLGINPGTLVKYEAGEREPGFGLIKKIVELTKTNTSWLLLGTGPKEENEEVSIYTLYPDIPRDDCDSLDEMLAAMNSSKVYYHRVMMEWAKIRMEPGTSFNNTEHSGKGGS